MSGRADIERVIKNLDTFSKNIVREIVYGAQAVQQKTVNDARGYCPVGVTGALAHSIQAGVVTVQTDPLKVEAIVEANADYASFVEYGTKPHFPPVDALKEWAAKFLGDEKLAFVVARAIARRGNYAQPFMGPALLENMPVFRDAIYAAVQRGLEAGR